ncbi:hypothetical protein TVAG_409200 [Trichomonas vaginalis G3]|uniref:Uncharacterized protein n=1 Tax=Trichomonas vaginalis (strain ATCC PRA-98 / G3) TaxID=412133 RepID=A2GIQ7_TRIV3|nr:hypothetical protein TVAGG3_0374790 [Trichomonas vaginalis G3]EAX82957.1 hypothetical protein TVAG_409200 [Trichomonas vaginalis G3]KAI5532861.1 hypothetical protein TVAGG3_0374790 [Trichomonas vaginalis G3]|eukprot:XP_001295887.1 hypothetical protein [Trichomonas vaginalis G3]
MVNCLVKSFWHSESFLLAFRVLPSGIPSPSFWHSESFLLAFRVLPSDKKKISRQLEKNFLLFVRKPFKFSKIENFLVELQKKFFLPTGKNFPSNRKNSSFRQENIFLPTGHKRMSDVPPTESIPKPEEPTAPAPQQTKTKTLYFLRLTFYNLNFVCVDMNSERSMRVLYDFVLLP